MVQCSSHEKLALSPQRRPAPLKKGKPPPGQPGRNLWVTESHPVCRQPGRFRFWGTFHPRPLEKRERERAREIYRVNQHKEISKWGEEGKRKLQKCSVFEVSPSWFHQLNPLENTQSEGACLSSGRAGLRGGGVGGWVGLALRWQTLVSAPLWSWPERSFHQVLSITVAII